MGLVYNPGSSVCAYVVGMLYICFLMVNVFICFICLCIMSINCMFLCGTWFLKFFKAFFEDITGKGYKATTS